ncbi:DUF2796 domain-containing protein [Motiliproteus sp. MSK22-1]|uniref:DUF2796 domain-containing protein n=1 Tax=Motiliproteus sp. MSK22-1 TaxID=1897630 RepID=UPI0009789314|nr:DUF2796 domain-containing protein [Motiliproteus sp. MSK22-1]OMH26638.1 hypothetical protein BGP75_23360 [Motiliproteus sp. MSK22-1]
MNIFILSLLTCASVSSAIAEERRQHDVHEHGGGLLNVAIEKNKLLIDLSMPAMNIAGFEHIPTNQDERGKVEWATMWLEDGLRLFNPSPAANCKLIHAKVDSALLEDKNHHDDSTPDVENHKSHEEHHHDELKPDEEDHADFDIEYEFNCAEPKHLSELRLALFEVFPGALHLRTQAVTATDQLSVELNAENNILKLK